MAKQKTWLDSLQALSIIALVLSYVASIVLFPNNGLTQRFSLTPEHFGYLLLNSATLFAYPMILMVSGVVLLSREYELKSYYKHRLLRVVTPLLTWLVIYTVYLYFITPNTPTEFRGIATWAGKLFVEQSISPHFWFATMLVALFAVAPFLGSIVRNLKPTMLYFLLGAWVLIANISKDLYIDNAGWSGGYLVKAIHYFVYSGYMVLGYALYNLHYASKNIRISAWIIFAVTLFIPPIMAYYSHKMDTTIANDYYNLFNLNTIIQASSLFIAFKETQTTHRITRIIQENLSEYIYSIYLVFVLIAQTLLAYCIKWGGAHPMLSIPILTILTLFFSFAILFILRKLSFGKHLAG